MGKEILTRFPEAPLEITALDYYCEFVYPNFSNPRDEVYFSATAKSGGAFARVTDLPPDFSPRGKMALIFALNTRIAREMISIINNNGLLPDGVVQTLPHLIKQRPNWQEFDFVRFWIYYISGLNQDSAVEFEELAKAQGVGQADSEILDNSGDRWLKRWGEYQRLITTFTEFLDNKKPKLNPISRIILLHGHENSLGCRLERELAEKLRIQVMEVVFDRNHPDCRNTITRCFKDILETDHQLGILLDGYNPSIPTISGDGRFPVCLLALPRAKTTRDF